MDHQRERETRLLNSVSLLFTHYYIYYWSIGQFIIIIIIIQRKFKYNAMATKSNEKKNKFEELACKANSNLTKFYSQNLTKFRTNHKNGKFCAKHEML